MSSEADHFEAVMALLEAGGAVPYSRQDALRVSVLPPAFNEVGMERRYGGVKRSTGVTRARGYRITIRSVGRTLDGAREMRRLAAASIEEAHVTVDGRRSRLIEFETEDPFEDPVDGWFAATSLFTYAT